ncbi:putative disease resistance protein RGA1 [Euphorbia lathyris]|uniref:putative disease resistance protein RGA1 n=1 Tax=Euphorbia lathyris TaxID=212925 RepID=UPI003313E4AE
MAEAIPFGLATHIVTELNSSLFQQIGSIYGVEADLHKLENTLSTIKAALLDAEERQHKSHLVQDWIRKLKDAIFDADDLLDLTATRVSQLEPEKKVRQFFFSPNSLPFRYKMAHEIKRIRGRLDRVAEDMAKFNFRDRVIDSQIGIRERGQTHSFVLESEIIGRFRVKEEIIELLMSNNGESCSVIPIVGIGGLGKTTLAQFVYNDEKVVSYFEKRVWICVTEDFDVEIVARKILTSLTNGELSNLDLDMDLLQTRLREHLNDKMFLVVLDDMWNENVERWVRLKNLLVGGAKGSKILVTTRSRKVASIMGVEGSCLLKGLTEEESWTLFKRVAFREGGERVDGSLEAIGKRMVKRCQGVPLAIKSLGSAMQFKADVTDWLAVENSEIWKMSQDSNDVLPVLKLSYDHLPVYLRQCFAYCSIFPKGYCICKDQLIQLWMAQGYVVTSSSGNQNLEEIGDQYFNDLLLRSFFQEVEKDDYGGIVTCKMHDLIHDLAQTVAGSDCSISGTNAENVSKRVRHLSFERSLYYAWEVPRLLQQVKGLRTFLIPVNDRCINESSQAALISNLRRLRVLDMHCLGIEKLPCSIGELKHLRYLDVSNNNLLERLPDSISNLLNLQTLLLSRCERLVELPRGLVKLVNLRHLVINKCSRLAQMPPGLGELTSLRTLTRFIVRNGEGTWSDAAKLNELSSLNLLRGGIWLKNLHCLSADADSEAKEANLKSKMYLQFLGLQWIPSEVDVSTRDESLMEILEPHSNLKHLWVEGCGGIKVSTWISSLTNIVRITIRSCPKCRYLPPLEHLPSLRFLHLHNLPALEYIEYDFNEIFSSSTQTTTVFFPSLEELWLYKLNNFRGWQRREMVSRNNETTEPLTARNEQYIQHLFPCITQLSIQRCSKLTSIPFFSHLESLHVVNSSMMVIAASVFVPFRSSLSPFSTIESLFIDKVEDLECFPEEGLQKLVSLKTLRVKNCPRLTFLSPGINCLNRLTTLEINECSMLDLNNDTGIEWQCFRSLCHLIIDYLPRLVSLPEGLQNATALQELRILNCYNLDALPEWIRNFSSLRELEISDCSSLNSFPEGIHELASLQKMKIVNGPNLSSIFRRNTGSHR